MPRIRDWVYSYHATTNQTYIDVPLPVYQPGDLLIALLSTDTGLQTWSSSGWTVLFSANKGASSSNPNLAIMYKFAGASETSPVRFTYTAAETANGCIISIMDTNPNSGDGSDKVINAYATADMTANKQAMPSATVSNANSLVLFCWNHGTINTALPACIEGSTTFEISKDGAAHNDGFAWTFAARTGSTPTAYCTVTGTTYDGVLATVVINPPPGGAQEIPAYCVSDSSIYVDPIHGTSAFRGNSALLSTNVTTNFGTSIGGITLAGVAVANRADYGLLWGFRPCGGVSSLTNSTWGGGCLQLATANRPNASGKNILIHAMPYQPVDIQTVYDAGTGTGVAIGLCSTAGTDYKVWHVHGAGTSWGTSRVPLVVNPSNTSGVIQSTGTLDASSILAFLFAHRGFLVATDWVYTMIWVLDTTVIAGGNVSNPVGISDIRKVAADGHERMSVVQQAANQLLVLQPLQFGDGGTNPIYLDLNSTAIEFPKQYDRASKQTYYCSVDNVAGITYYAGPNDVIKHRNSVVSSPSKFHWKFHPNSATNATYDFFGLSIIGAGLITLKSGLPLSGITFTSCDEIEASGAIISNCLFKQTTGAGALKVNTASEMSSISNCTFSNNSYGIRLMNSSADTYTFNNIKFNNNTKDVYIAATSGTVTINVINGGDTPTYESAGATVVINNLKTLTLTGLPTGSDVRILEAGTQNVLAGTDNSGTTFEYNYNYEGNQYVDIVVLHLDYEYFRLENYELGPASATLPIPLRRDRWYENP